MQQRYSCKDIKPVDMYKQLYKNSKVTHAKTKTHTTKLDIDTTSCVATRNVRESIYSVSALCAVKWPNVHTNLNQQQSRAISLLPTANNHAHQYQPLSKVGIGLHDCLQLVAKFVLSVSIHVYKVSNGAKIRNRYNQVPHLTQDTNGKVTNSQKTPQTRAKRSALSQQVTTKHI